jgi:hypothetical protein
MAKFNPNTENKNFTFISNKLRNGAFYTAQIIDITDPFFTTQAVVLGKKKGNNIVIADSWAKVKAKGVDYLPGTYRIVSENNGLILTEKI